MSEMENLDIETKVKMMFALGAPVSNGLLIELKKEADVELDERHRIINYNKHGKSLQLSGVHSVRPCDTSKEKEMLKFLAEKSENVTSPMTDNVFLRGFNSSEGNLDNISSLKQRYSLLKKQIYLAAEFDEKTKIKMMFLSNTKVHANILEVLRKTAVVEVDEFQRITKYEANDGSLTLEGKQKKIKILLKATEGWSKKETENLLSFIADKSKQTKYPLILQHLSREFAEKNVTYRTKEAVAHYLYRYLPNISKLNDFDIKTRMRMLFTLSVPVDGGFLKKLRKEAVVEVDEHRRITKYEANDGSLKLETERSPPLTGWSNEENDKLWNYITEKSKQTKEPLNITILSKEFAEKNRMSRTTDAVRRNIKRSLIPKISKQDDADMETKIRMMFAMSAPVDEEFLNELRKEAVVEIDEKRRIIKYEANNGSLELKGDHSISAKLKTILTQKNKNILIKTEAGQSRKSINGISETSEIDEETEEDEDEGMEEASKPNRKIGRRSKKRYPEDDLFCDSDDDACESSGRKKKTKIQKTEKITKRATSQTLKRRKIRNTYFSETDETEDDESEEEYEYKEGSKKRFPNNDFSCDVDDVSFDYPDNLNDSKMEEETEKLVDMPSDSSSRVPIVKNQKRKVGESPFQDTNSSSKSRKYEKDANKNNTKTVKTSNRTNGDEEMTYDGAGEPPGLDELPIKQEPLSYQEVKLENQEYKPDLSFLCGTTQNIMQSFSEVEVNHTEDLDQSTENTEEMASGKEFMKSLRGLVTSLDSPILDELQSKIEDAIENIGDQDHRCPIDEIAMTLNTGLIILNKKVTMEPLARESISLRDFFLILQSTLSTFGSSSLNNFQLKIKKNMKKLDSQDKMIPIESIRPVLETLLLLAMP